MNHRYYTTDINQQGFITKENMSLDFWKLSGSFEGKIVDIELRLSGVWLLVTKKLPFRISEFEMIQATF